MTGNSNSICAWRTNCFRRSIGTPPEADNTEDQGAVSTKTKKLSGDEGGPLASIKTKQKILFQREHYKVSFVVLVKAQAVLL